MTKNEFDSSMLVMNRFSDHAVDTLKRYGQLHEKYGQSPWWWPDYSFMTIYFYKVEDEYLVFFDPSSVELSVEYMYDEAAWASLEKNLAAAKAQADAIEAKKQERIEAARLKRVKNKEEDERKVYERLKAKFENG
jgi:hypothetical protein